MAHKTTPSMKLARRLLSQKEISKGVSPHNGKVYCSRRKARLQKEFNKANVNKK